MISYIGIAIHKIGNIKNLANHEPDWTTSQLDDRSPLVMAKYINLFIDHSWIIHTCAMVSTSMYPLGMSKSLLEMVYRNS